MRRILFHARVLAVLSVAAMMVVPVSPAQAKVVRTEFQCSSYWVDFQEGEGFRSWDVGNTSHGRNGIESLYDEGDPYCTGDETVYANTNVNPVWGDVPWGTFSYDIDGLEGGFEGTWHVKYASWVYEEVGTGYGYFEGLQFRAIWEWNPDYQGGTRPDLYGTLTGYVFGPGG